MGYIYTGFTDNRSLVHRFKIGMTTAEESPLGRIYANKLIETGCVYVPNARKSQLLLLESAARCAAEGIAELTKESGKDDWFIYEKMATNIYEKRLIEWADEVIAAVVKTCEQFNIPYEVNLKGWTMRGRCLRLITEKYGFGG